ncbi:MAG: hypothetical protein ACM3IJ_05955 [Candidatus Levyibacteriota bacterium]
MLRSAEVLAHPVAPREAVADAMMSYQATFVDRFLKVTPSLPVSNEQFQQIVDTESKLHCLAGSRFVIDWLAHRYSELFDAQIILKGRWTKHFPAHHIFLTHGVDGVWYAGSPANNTQHMKRFSILYEDPDLDVVLDMIKRDEGGEWPTSKDIGDIFPTK